MEQENDKHILENDTLNEILEKLEKFRIRRENEWTKSPEYNKRMDKAKKYTDKLFRLIPPLYRSTTFAYDKKEVKVFAIMTMINASYLSMEILQMF